MNIATASLVPFDATSAVESRAAQADARQKDAATQLEGVFVSMLLKTMRETMTEGEMFGNDTSDIWGGIFDQAMGDAVAKDGGLGLAEQLSLADAVRARGLSAITP